MTPGKAQPQVLALAQASLTVRPVPAPALTLVTLVQEVVGELVVTGAALEAQDFGATADALADLEKTVARAHGLARMLAAEQKRGTKGKKP